VELDGVPINEALSEAATFAIYDGPASFDLWWKRQPHEPRRA
jgi:hypothetical protein